VLLMALRQDLAVGFYDLKVVVVHPYPSREIALVFHHLLGVNVEYISVQFVLLLLADVEDVIFPNFIRGQHEGEAVLDVVKIFRRHPDPGECGLWREDHVLDLASLVVEGHVEDLLVHSVRGVAVQRHDLYVLAVGVLIARFLELFLLVGEALDDLISRDPLGIRFVERALLCAGCLGKCNDRQEGAKQCGETKGGERKQCRPELESHKPYSSERGHRKVNGSLHPQSRRANGPTEGWKTAVLPISLDATVAGKLAGFTFLYFRALGMALAIPHSTNPGNN